MLFIRNIIKEINFRVLWNKLFARNYMSDV